MHAWFGVTHMNIYEALGFTWVIFTSTLATIELLYFAYRGVKLSFQKLEDGKVTDVPEKARKIFKVAGAE